MAFVTFALSCLVVVLVIALLVLTVWWARLQRAINRHQITVNALTHARIGRLEYVIFGTDSDPGSTAVVVH
jgi:hypothetical protein